ncbi:MAG: serine/threonine-protein kinase PknK [Candidatus Parabeggiatoa sp. nov. 3]|nr:MAG: serine/threonine-protein kinase PknK [Gammaproteobacteria bacterium]RKZ79694.1 MAG: serine/threonine-protein kinase PknK [Gammaproteobacteria bacterium]
MLILPNYQIQTLIYESANSIVYRGVRSEDNQSVILKMLKADYPTPEELTRYRQEYDITKSLDIDGVIKTDGIEKYQNTYVIVLEDFGAEALKKVMSEMTFSLRVFLSVAIKVAAHLGQIHAAHVIHKDINPSNIVFNPTTQQLKIIDFGIASRLPRETPTLKNPSQLEGTLAYISPEQTGRMNRALDYRTDLYSLGVTFYELLTGKVPFEADSPLELVHCLMAKTPTPVCEVNPDIPPMVSDIVMKLMAKNVEDRYQSAFGVKADFSICQHQLETENRIEAFELAQNDFSGQFQIPQKLYGRENETKTLLHAFERIAHFQPQVELISEINALNPSLSVKCGGEMMLVAGYSGVGKTALVHEVHKPMTEKHGYFAAGKFDQFQRNIPYSAISQAFNEFCQYLLTETADELIRWRDQILKAVGNNGQILIDVINQLELIIGPQPLVAEVGSLDAQNRFNLVFQNFFRAICQKEHPLVLFIDDLQWADSASLNLLKTLMTDTDSHYFLIIGAYRDNEVDEAHPLMMTLEALQKAGALLNTISLANLSKTDVNRLITDALKCEPLYSEPLTQLVYDKTLGNAFFIHEFLKSLYQQALLVFDLKTQQWQWDIDKIAALDIADNVVELMAGKISRFSSETQTALKLGACIGSQFDLKTLSLIGQYSQSDTLSHLWAAIEAGLLLPLDDHYKSLETTADKNSRFKFQHDRIQQAAYSLIPEADKSALHLKIGRLLLANTAEKDLEEHVFEIVNQLNSGQALITDEEERITLVRLNLQAGNKAKAGTAIHAAINYFSKGITLLDALAWQPYYSEAFELYKEQGECEFLSGHFDRSEQLLAIALENARSKFDKAAIYVIKIAQRAGQGQFYEAVATLIEGLNLFGLNVPTLDQAYEQATATEIALYQDHKKNRQIEDLWHLPLMQDEEMKVCSQMIAMAFDSIAIKLPNLLAFYATKTVNMSIQYGLSPFIPVGYSFFTIICSGGFKDYTSAYQFAALALRLNQDKLINSSVKTKIHNMYALFNVLREHINVSIEYFRETYRVALENGDFLFAGHAIIELPRYLFPISIAEGRKATQEAIAHCWKVNNQTMLLLAQMYEGFIKNVQGEINKTTFNHGAFTEEALINAFETAAPLFCAVYKRQKLLSLSLFECYEQALSLVHERATWIAAIAAIDISFRSDYYLHTGITCAALYADASEADKETYLDILNESLAENQRLFEQCEANFEHAYLILQAEKARIENNPMFAMQCYDKAIASARVQGYRCNEALAYELAARFWFTQQKEDFALIYLRGAHYAYQQWGATGKVHDLEERYPQLIAPIIEKPLHTMAFTTSMTRMASISSQSTSKALDLESVMKAAQTLSGEIVLSRLLETMMQIVVENAGACRGLLLLPQQEQWFIEAESEVNGDTLDVLQSIPIDDNQKVAASMIHYVARTQEPVVLNNACVEGHFTQDIYILKNEPQSVLCTPLLNQGKLTGILYLENDLTEYAFTEERLQVLKVLSSQMAISIENALLYQTLEEKVVERTAQLAQRTEQLADANEEITALNEQLTSENVRMSAELDVSRRLQQMLLPKENELKQIEGLDIAGFMEPASEVGGDYYDVLHQDGRVLIGIGDVTGHGLESGVLALMVQSIVRALMTHNETNLLNFLNTLNRTIYDNVLRMNSDKNLSFALLELREKTLFLSGQHEEMIVVRNGFVERVDTDELGFPIGLEPDINDFIAQRELLLNTGDVVVLYTDGITEAENIEQQLYGLERLCAIVSRHWQDTAEEIVQAVIADVRQYIGSQKVYFTQKFLRAKTVFHAKVARNFCVKCEMMISLYWFSKSNKKGNPLRQAQGTVQPSSLDINQNVGF